MLENGITITLVLQVYFPTTCGWMGVWTYMQHDVMAEFFTRLLIIIVLLMMLAVIAIPEIVSIIDESFTQSA